MEITQRNLSFAVESGHATSKFDDDGRVKRTGTVASASAHIITAVIGSGVLSLAWAMAQLGWIAGIAAMLIFSLITLFTSSLLADSYRSPDPVTNFQDLAGLSYVAAVMSFSYACIGIGLSIARIADGKAGKTSIIGVSAGVDVTISQKVWNCLQAIGNIAFAYSYSNILIEIQDTLKSSPPENLVMKRAAAIGVLVTTCFYFLCGVLGYAAFGNRAPGNFLTGFGFYEPYWLIDIANICIIIHLVGAYQVFSQPLHQNAEKWFISRCGTGHFIVQEHQIVIPFVGIYNVSFLRLIWRTTYVICTSVIAMMFPVFNSVLGLIGAAAFWPMTVYLPIEMHISQAKIRSFSLLWIWLKILCWACLIVSLVAGAACIQGIISELKHYQPFKSVS